MDFAPASRARPGDIVATRDYGLAAIKAKRASGPASTRPGSRLAAETIATAVQNPKENRSEILI